MNTLDKGYISITATRGNWYFHLLIIIFIFLNLLPSAFVIEPVNVTHFFSSHHLFEYASHHGFRYGIDIIDNVGPYGYLHYPYTYAGNVYWTKIIWFALVCSIYAYYANSLIEKFQTLPEKLIFLFVVVFFPLRINFPWSSFEAIPRLAVLFSALYFFTDSKEKKAWHEAIPIVFNGFFYAFLILEKASNVYYLMLIVMVLSLHWLVQKKWHNIFWLCGSVISGVLLFWLAAGQPFSGLLNYFKSMQFFIDSYQNIMPQPMNMRDFYYGICYCISVGIILLMRFITSFYLAPSWSEFFRSILIAALVFLVWKHGMLRNLDSYSIFLFTMPIVISIICFYPMKTRADHVPENNLARLYTHRYFPLFRSICCLILLFVVWTNIKAYEQQTNSYRSVVREFANRLDALLHFRPIAKLNQLNEQFAQLKHDNALPASLKNTLGRHSVDEFGSVPEILLLNDLNYKPRPVPIDFIVANSALNNKNAQYYQNAKTAPDFVLLPDLGTHLMDNKAYLSLLLNYEATDTIQNWFVMQKKSEWHNMSFSKEKLREAHFDQWISLGLLQQTFLWVQIEATPSILGRLQTFLYKPDFLRLDVLLENGFTQHYHLSLAQLKSGFLLNPVIKTKAASGIPIHAKRHGAYWANDPTWDLAHAFRLSVSDNKINLLFRPEFKIIFSKIATTSSATEHPIALDLSRAHNLIRFFSPNFKIYKLHTQFPINLLGNAPRYDISVDGLSPLEINATSRWRWALGPMTRISFYCDPKLSDSARRLLLQLSFRNSLSIPGQTVGLRLNGKTIYNFPQEEVLPSKQLDADIPINARKGENTLEIFYQDWNHGTKRYTQRTNDLRELAVEITRLRVTQENKLGV